MSLNKQQEGEEKIEAKIDLPNREPIAYLFSKIAWLERQIQYSESKCNEINL